MPEPHPRPIHRSRAVLMGRRVALPLAMMVAASASQAFPRNFTVCNSGKANSLEVAMVYMGPTEAFGRWGYFGRGWKSIGPGRCDKMFVLDVDPTIAVWLRLQAKGRRVTMDYAGRDAMFCVNPTDDFKWFGSTIEQNSKNCNSGQVPAAFTYIGPLENSRQNLVKADPDVAIANQRPEAFVIPDAALSNQVIRLFSATDYQYSNKLAAVLEPIRMSGSQQVLECTYPGTSPSTETTWRFWYKQVTPEMASAIRSEDPDKIYVANRARTECPKTREAKL